MAGIVLHKCLISVAFQERSEETEAKRKIGMTQTKTVWLVESFTNDRKQLFHVMKNKFKSHHFCLEASELHLLQIWKTAPYQDT